MNTLKQIVGTLLLVGTTAASAQFLALDSTRGTGNQSWTGALGMDFDVLSPITVTQLGAFDSLQDGFVGTITVGIFNRSNGNLVGSSAALTGSSSPLVDGQQRMFDIADFNLGAGFYSIVAIGFGSVDRNGNNDFGAPAPTINTGGGLIAFVGTSRFGAQGGVFELPTGLDGGPANRYDAGTFSYTTAVPEPTSYALALVALGIVGGFARKASKTPC